MTSIFDGKKKLDLFPQCNGMLISDYMEKYIDSEKMALRQIYGPATQLIKHRYLQLEYMIPGSIMKGIWYSDGSRCDAYVSKLLDNRRLELHSTLARQAYRHNCQSNEELRPVQICDAGMI